jgi:hypothetical protein
MSDYLLHQANGEFSTSTVLSDDSSAALTTMSDNSRKGTKEKLKRQHIPNM